MGAAPAAGALQLEAVAEVHRVAQRSQVVTVPQLRQASRRARPVRLSTQTTRLPEPATSRATSTKGSARTDRCVPRPRPDGRPPPGAPTSAAVPGPSDVTRSATERAPLTGTVRPAGRAPWPDGPARWRPRGRSRSATTRSADPDRPPRTPPPLQRRKRSEDRGAPSHDRRSPAAAAKSWGQRATAALPQRTAKRSAVTTEGCTTNAWPPRAAAAAHLRGSARRAAPSRRPGPGLFASTARTSKSTPASPWGRGRTGGDRAPGPWRRSARISVGNRPGPPAPPTGRCRSSPRRGPPRTPWRSAAAPHRRGVELGSITHPATSSTVQRDPHHGSHLDPGRQRRHEVVVGRSTAATSTSTDAERAPTGAGARSTAGGARRIGREEGPVPLGGCRRAQRPSSGPEVVHGDRCSPT